MFASNPPLKYGASPRNSKSNNFFRRANHFNAFCSLLVSRITRIDNGTMHATLARRASMSAMGHEENNSQRAYVVGLSPVSGPCSGHQAMSQKCQKETLSIYRAAFRRPIVAY